MQRAGDAKFYAGREGTHRGIWLWRRRPAGLLGARILPEGTLQRFSVDGFRGFGTVFLTTDTVCWRRFYRADQEKKIVESWWAYGYWADWILYPTLIVYKHLWLDIAMYFRVPRLCDMGTAGSGTKVTAGAGREGEK